MTTRPIEIIGGGLAGLSLGVALRREGIPVTIHETGEYPRHRVCGEFITGLGTSTIARLGLASALQGALRHREVAWTTGNARPVIQRLPAPALGVSRHFLDAHLAQTFSALGGVLHTSSRVTDLTPRAGRVFATGRRRATDPQWIGLKVHVRELALTRDLEMHLGQQSYVGLSRVAEAVNVCGLFRRRALQGQGADLLIRYVRAAGLDSLADRLAAAPVDVSSFCAVAGLMFDARVVAPGDVSVGDACAMTPPYTGNGMAMAFQSAEAALDPLFAYARGTTPWHAAGIATARALRKRFRVRLAFAQALHSFLLQPRRQRWFAALGRARLLPLGSLYATLH